MADLVAANRVRAMTKISLDGVKIFFYPSRGFSAICDFVVLYAPVLKSLAYNLARGSVATPPLLSVDQVCREAPFSRSSFYRLVRQGRLAIKKLGRRTMVERSELERFKGDLPCGNQKSSGKRTSP
jgi:excisionase family DNA binding protein